MATDPVLARAVSKAVRDSLSRTTWRGTPVSATYRTSSTLFKPAVFLTVAAEVWQDKAARDRIIAAVRSAVGKPVEVSDTRLLRHNRNRPDRREIVFSVQAPPQPGSSFPQLNRRTD